jgi:penicillin-binding protein A
MRRGDQRTRKVRKQIAIALGIAVAACFAAGVVVSRTGLSFAQLDPPTEPTTYALPTDRGTPEETRVQGLDLASAELRGDRYYIAREDGSEIELTLDPDLQNRAEQLLARYEVPQAGLVMIEPNTGRVLAYVGHGAEEGNPAVQAIAPSASLFKIVTAAALLSKGVPASHRVCYQATLQRPTLEDVQGDAPQNECTDLATAFGRSTNPVFARLAEEKLTRQELHEWAARFGYNEPIPFDLPVDVSVAEIPSDPLDRAHTAAGFWNTYLSPLHAAMLSATVAAGGVMMRPTLVQSITSADGETVHTFRPRPWKIVLEPEVARELAGMMRYTTTVGTARTYFADDKNWPGDENYVVAGKTGTLTGAKPYVMYSWFSGFAPLSSPDVAIGTVLFNPARWRIKAGYTAAWMLRPLAQAALPEPEPVAATPAPAAPEPAAEQPVAAPVEVDGSETAPN